MKFWVVRVKVIHGEYLLGQEMYTFVLPTDGNGNSVLSNVQNEFLFR